MLEKESTIVVPKTYSINLGNSLYKCTLCPLDCVLKVGEVGRCMARHATEDGVVLKAFGKITTIAAEPIEKKPIYHYKPNSRVLSIGGYGCSMTCDYCQNYMVSQKDRAETSKSFTTDEIVDLAIQKNCQGICMTYNEPTIYFEFLLELAEKAHSRGLFFTIKTNGCLSFVPWKEVCKVVDAMNVDYKGSLRRYRDVAGIDVDAYYQILDNLGDAIEEDNLHVEVSVPVYHDARVDEYFDLKDLLARVGRSVPVHLLKIFPANKIQDQPTTPDDIIFQLKDYFLEFSKFVYVQNIFGDNGLRDTICPSCGIAAIKRKALQSDVSGMCSCVKAYIK